MNLRSGPSDLVGIDDDDCGDGAALRWGVQPSAAGHDDATTQHLLTTVLTGVALFDIGLFIWLFLASWQPVAEKSLKKSLGGRLFDPAEGKTMGRCS